MKPLYVPCPQCSRMLTSEGCSNPRCSRGFAAGFTLPPPPKLTTQPDPFPAVCSACGQPLPKPA